MRQPRHPSRPQAPAPSIARRVAAKRDALTPIERRVAEFIAGNREEALVAPAAKIAERVGTSDATVVRTAKSLGYAGLAAMRREIADELRASLAPAARLARTLDAMPGDPAAALGLAIETHQASLERLRESITPELFDAAVAAVADAGRVAVFGLGPSSALADYLAMQLGRFGFDAITLTRSGLLFADDLHRLRAGDTLVMLAYTRPYLEVDALLERAKALRLKTLLVTDTLGDVLGKRVKLVLPVARGRAEMFSTHTATLGLIEALLIGVAARRQPEVVGALASLNRLRERTAGRGMDLKPPSARARRQKGKGR